LSARQLLFLVAVAGILFFAGLGRLPLLEPDEGRNAEVAREMLTSGNLITPHFNTLVYLDKPAVYFWLVAASFRLWGVTEWAARFPSALMALATMLLTWFLARRMFGGAAGLRAGIMLATTPLVLAYSRLVIFDMTLAFLVTVAMASFWFAAASGYRRPWLDVILFAAMGLATITKGPVGFLLPLLSILAYQAARGQFRELKRLRWGLGLVVFLAAALPWFIAVSVRNPDFPRYALWEESLKRFATGSTRRGGSFFYYVPVYLGGFFPWSLFLLFAGWNRLKRWRELRQETHKPVVFLLAWAVVIFVFFSISRSKLPGYFLPATVPLSLLMAKVWEEMGTEGAQPRPDWLTAGFAALIGLGLVTTAAPQAFRFATVQVALTEKIHPTVVALMKPSLFYSGLILVALGFFGRNLAARRTGKTLAVVSLTLLALTAPLLLVRWIEPLRIHAATLSSRQLARTILGSSEKDLPLYGYYCFRTSLPFYLRRPVGLVTADASELTSNYVSARLPELRRQAPRVAPASPVDPEPLLIDGTDLRARARYSPKAMLVMVRNRDVRKLSQAVPQMEPLWNDWEYSVWKIPAAEVREGTGNREQPNDP
jgi:4-amino-4-deoxy-L-arabinose transferase-like glycosyltransferase